MPAIAISHAVPDEVVRYCESHGLLSPLQTALHLVDECFQPIERLEVSVEADPGVEGEETVVIDLWVKMSVEEGLKRQSAYIRQWVDSVPPAVTGQIVVIHHVL